MNIFHVSQMEQRKKKFRDIPAVLISTAHALQLEATSMNVCCVVNEMYSHSMTLVVNFMLQTH